MSRGGPKSGSTPVEPVEPIVRVPPSFDAEFPDASRLATEVFLNIGFLAGTVRAAVEAMATAEGLTSLAAFNVLTVLAGDPEPLRPSVIADRMTVTRATMTGLLDSMERRGLVRRVDRPGDARARPVELTRPGREIASRLVPAIHRFEAQLMGVLADNELEGLVHLVARLQRRILELAPDVSPGIR